MATERRRFGGASPNEPPDPMSSPNHNPLVVDLFADVAHGVPDRSVNRFASLVKWAPGDACWEWQGYRQPRASGVLSYGVFCVGKRRYLAHRMAVLLSTGELPDNAVVRHRCDNVACVRPDHLELGTQAQNLEDMRVRGRGHINTFPAGPSHPMAKLDKSAVLRVVELKAQGLSLAKIGAQFGIDPSTVHDIVNGRIWGHATGIKPTPEGPARRLLVTLDGETKPLRAWCTQFGLPYKTIHARVRRGADPMTVLVESRGAA